MPTTRESKPFLFVNDCVSKAILVIQFGVFSLFVGCSHFLSILIVNIHGDMPLSLAQPCKTIKAKKSLHKHVMLANKSMCWNRIIVRILYFVVCWILLCEFYNILAPNVKKTNKQTQKTRRTKARHILLISHQQIAPILRQQNPIMLQYVSIFVARVKFKPFRNIQSVIYEPEEPVYVPLCYQVDELWVRRMTIKCLSQ